MVFGMEHKTLELSKISLDLKNPRHEEFQDEASVIEHLCKEESVLALAEDIAEHGLNPIDLLAVIKRADGTIFCAEGNRRICVLKLLKNPNLAPKKLQNNFVKFSKVWKPIEQIDVVEFKDRNEARLWLDRIHGGEDKGVGRLHWNTVQKARNSTKHKSKFEVVVLEHGKNLGFVLSSDWHKRLSTVTIYLANRLMRKTIGLEKKDVNLLNKLSSAELSAFKKFMEDVDKKVINTRAGKKEIEIYAKNLINKGAAGKTGFNTGTTSAGGSGSGTPPKSPKPIEPLKREVIPLNTELEKALQELDIYKLRKIYYSLCKIDLQEHAPLLYVGAWSFLETLTALFSERGKKKFSDYLNLKEIISLSIVKSNEASAVFQAVERICNVGNTTKHNKTAAGFDGEQLANDFEEMNPLLVYLVKKAIKEKNKAN